MSDLTEPLPEDDEALAEFLCDRLLERAAAEGGRFLLAALHMAGLREVPSEPLSQPAVARNLGHCVETVRRIEHRALRRLRRKPDVQQLKS